MARHTYVCRRETCNSMDDSNALGVRARGFDGVRELHQPDVKVGARRTISQLFQQASRLAPPVTADRIDGARQAQPCSAASFQHCFGRPSARERPMTRGRRRCLSRRASIFAAGDTPITKSPFSAPSPISPTQARCAARSGAKPAMWLRWCSCRASPTKRWRRRPD